MKREYNCLMVGYEVVKSELEKIHNKIDKDDIYHSDIKGEFGLETEPHVTVLFGLHEGVDWKDFEDILPPLSEFETIFNNISLFENVDYDVLKFGVKSEKLIEINNKLRDKVEYTNSYENYLPHLTIGYLKSGSGKKYIKDMLDKIELFKPNKYVYSKVDGSKEEYIK